MCDGVFLLSNSSDRRGYAGNCEATIQPYFSRGKQRRPPAEEVRFDTIYTTIVMLAQLSKDLYVINRQQRRGDSWGMIKTERVYRMLHAQVISKHMKREQPPTPPHPY